MRQLFLLVCFSLLISCEKPKCENVNPILAANPPQSEPYKAELARLIEIEGADNLEYYVDSYREINGRGQLSINIEGASICAKAVVMITDTTNGIEEIIRTKGMGYRNAELSGLKFDIVRKDGNTAFIYKGVGSIID